MAKYNNSTNSFSYDKGSTVFNVINYGATGDGTTDDTAAIQAAVDAAQAAGGGVVWFPKGTYSLSTNPIKLYSGTTPTIVSYTNITLRGAGSSGVNGTILKQNTTGVDVIQGRNDAANGAQCLNLTFKDFSMVWGTATLTNSGNGIYLKQQAANGPSFQQCTFENVTAVNMQATGKYGFNFESMITSTVTDCQAQACANGFYLNGNALASGFDSVNTSVTLTNCYANMATNGVIGYKIYESTYMSLVGCAADIGANSAGPAYLIDTCSSVSMYGCGTELNGTATLTNVIKINASTQVGIYNNYGFQGKTGTYIQATGTSTGVTVIGYQVNSNISGTTGLLVDAGSEVTDIDCDFAGANTPRNINATGINTVLDTSSKLTIKQVEAHVTSGTGVAIRAIADSSDAGKAAVQASNANNFAQTGPVGLFQMLNASDTGPVIKLENAGTGNYITADAGMSLSKQFALSTKNVILGTGTTSVAPLKFQSGTNLTAAAAGNMEYDGKVFYTSPVASARGVSPSLMYSIISSNFTLQTAPGVQSAFPTTGDVWTLENNTTYLFNGQYYIDKSVGVVSVAMAFGLGGSVILTMFYNALAINGSGVTTTVQNYTLAVNQGSIVVSTASNGQTYIKFDGIIRTTTGGSFTPQISFSGTATTPAMRVGSYITFTPIGSNTQDTLGNVA